MFLGHYAVALAARKIAPEVRLGTLAMAAQWLDLLWPVFLLIGLEHASVEPHATRVTPLNFYDYPLSHSLSMAVLWGAAFAAVYYLSHRTLACRSCSAALVLALCVVSHWILDWISHRPDMPLWPGRSPLLGLGLWNHPAASVVVEFGGFAIALAIYWRTAGRSIRPLVFWPLVAFLLLIGGSSYFGGIPPGIQPVMWSAIAQWILVAWAYAAEDPVIPRAMPSTRPR
jgi:hypothetical protein